MQIDLQYREPRIVGLTEIDKALIAGTFTPVVGAACSSLEYRDEPRAELSRDIRRKALSLAGYISTTICCPDAAEDVRHLYELVPPSSDEVLEPTPTSMFGELGDLLHALIHLDRLACRLFQPPWNPIQSAAAMGGAISLWRRDSDRQIQLPRRSEDWEVSLAGGEDADAFGRALTVAITAADTLFASKSECKIRSEDLGLGSIEIRNQLTALKRNLFGASDVPAHPALTLPDLIWLGHLLWHVLRFDLAYYPTSTELAFQLSLQASLGLLYVREIPSLAQAAQALADPLTHIKRWFTFYSSNSTKSEFYSTLADWLTRMYALHREPAEDSDRVPPLLPVVLTTNYDVALEKALDERMKPYHVLLPVRHIRWPKNRPESARRPIERSIWLLKTMRRRNDSARGDLWSPTWRYGGRATVPYGRSDEEAGDPYDTLGKLEGPLVIKLHGSPLDDLPFSTDDVRLLPDTLRNAADERRLAHRIVVSESDYLRDLRDDLPAQIQKILSQGNRTLVFLGQSVSDWNIRVRLADHVQWSRFGDTDNVGILSETIDDIRPEEQPRFAINKRVGRFDSGILGTLKIDVINTDLRDVHDRIEMYLPKVR